MRKDRKLKNWRIGIAFLFICAISAGIIFRLFSLQIIDYKFYSIKAKNQHEFSRTLNPRRGSIFMKDRFGDVYPLAINKDYGAVYVIPNEITDKENTAEKLSQILNVDKEIILNRISKKDDPYEPIKSKISDEELAVIKNETITGVYLSTKESRFYPYEDAASNLVGFVNAPDNEFIGQYGLEKFYDEELAGKKGRLIAEKGIGDAIIFTGERDYEPMIDGTDLILTLDPNVQFKAEEILKNAAEKWQAERGSVIISDPKTGAIKAMANWPSFDLNEYSKVKDINIFLNPAVQNIFEPGSVIKTITMATGLDIGVVSPDTKYIDEGFVKIGGYKIMNFDNLAHGEKTMREVLELSLNTGVVFVQKKIPKPVFKNYFEKFGFSEKTGIDLPGEVTGNILNLNTNRDINYATASFGQGIAITPVQLIVAIGALANQGKIMKPFVVDEFKLPDGKTIKTQPQEIRQVISSNTAAKIASIMTDVVKNGFDKRAGVEGYMVAGKTGTAQIPDGKGGYSDEFIHSFVGFAPAFDARFAVLIKLEKPKGNRFASNTLSSFFGELMNYLVSYYEIPPDNRASF
ncbi:MAG: Peptidoglycan glycosyltransferase [Parcubacteria group bacterium GW2011_GWD2_38_12]|nr:MAG: Peptidoglycan glycosyltransferase [Parcubacteria group bacterium GW2011_GWC2_36_17]KKQ39454.1 MAG: Peptidoglycan glycosyltransferase [Candidatus Moranbacteria bacterium GW2011_GWF2_37_7]KKQ51883.1 MAG: Peptidoglycan glycosyltransferase [Parcubacteria group bacterium GW2011_GWD2_38_12]KKQ58663.1 MAG: peptidoglycan glycosyltransferase, cell division protein FtsI (penicillin-binding protein 3) [Parcubacteria group bacterium GW2011_GWC1_38_17]KKQ59434.1 MAG: Peptidoglycan glycosyltransferas